MTYLLDVNVLIALIDPSHVAHDVAHAWFEREGRMRWATCPLTQNGILRIVGNPKYPNSPGSPAAAVGILESFCSLTGHEFWSDAISLIGTNSVDALKIMTSAQVTDTYLLALAVSRGGRLATFDRRLSSLAVAGGKQALCMLENA